jgi:hypothetical protein
MRSGGVGVRLHGPAARPGIRCLEYVATAAVAQGRMSGIGPALISPRRYSMQAITFQEGITFFLSVAVILFLWMQ